MGSRGLHSALRKTEQAEQQMRGLTDALQAAILLLTSEGLQGMAQHLMTYDKDTDGNRNAT